MLKMNDKVEEIEEPPSTIASPIVNGGVDNNTSGNSDADNGPGLIDRVVSLFKNKPDSTLRETLEEFIEDSANGDEGETSISSHEKTLISNILKLRDLCAADVMIPRADIVALPDTATQEDIFALLAETQYSRLPIYHDTLDNVVGCIHVKDILATLARGQSLVTKDLAREVPIVSPSIPVLDLLLQMRMSRKHMVLVVDEFGGIDGLVTIGDLIEDIVGQIDDEHDPEYHPEISVQTDGTVVADARVNLEEFEDQFGKMLSDEERDENDTLGGLVFFIAGRVPVRGEILHHHSGMRFEVIDASARRVNRLCIRDLPQIQIEEH